MRDKKKHHNKDIKRGNTTYKEKTKERCKNRQYAYYLTIYNACSNITNNLGRRVREKVR